MSCATRSPGCSDGIARAGFGLGRGVGAQRGGGEVAASGRGRLSHPGRRRASRRRGRGAPTASGGLGASPVDEVDRQLVEEARAGVVRRGPPGGADDGARDVEPLAGPGDADVGQAALLLELGLVAERPGVREDAVLEPGEEHDGELQPLGGVQRHQGDHPAVVVLVGDLVGVRDQRDALQEVGQPGHDEAGVDVGRVGRRPGDRVLGELPGHGDELGEVLHPGRVLGVVGLLERRQVARALQHGLEDDVGPLAGVDHRLELLDHRHEAPHLGQRAGGQPGCLVGAAQRLPEGQPVPVGQRRDARDRPVADAALGGVEDPAQRDLVGRVGQHPQVGERVADLAPLVEPHATDDLVGLPGADEHLLEDPGLGVGAVEDRHVCGRGSPSSTERVDLLGDEPGLVALVVGDVAHDPLAVTGVGPQRLSLRPSLWPMTALAAVRMVWVER